MPTRGASLTVAGLLLLSGIACHSRPVMGPLVAVPAELDSATTARWVAEQRAACRGTLYSIFDEDMIRRPRADSTIVYRYERSFTGVQCLKAGGTQKGV